MHTLGRSSKRWYGEWMGEKQDRRLRDKEALELTRREITIKEQRK